MVTHKWVIDVSVTVYEFVSRRSDRNICNKQWNEQSAKVSGQEKEKPCMIENVQIYSWNETIVMHESVERKKLKHEMYLLVKLMRVTVIIWWIDNLFKND